MKSRIIAAALGSLLLCSAGGCGFMELDLADALRPPKTLGDEAAIEKLISDAAKGSYTLKYPKNGSYRSAIIMNDLDGDDTAEAIAFFRGKDETTRLHMLVMRENEGKWISESRGGRDKMTPPEFYVWRFIHRSSAASLAFLCPSLLLLFICSCISL